MTSSYQKIVLITGCSAGGIGYHLCLEFAKDNNYKVFATARRLEAMKGLQAIPNILIKVLDITNDQQVKDVIKDIEETEGRIDILVNNAGAIIPGPIVDIPPSKIMELFDTNVLGAHRLVRAVFPSMATRCSGQIVVIGSVVGRIPTPWNGWYCASKAALHEMTEVLRSECKPFNIDVLLVAPAAVTSNISNAGSKGFELPKDSFYKSYLDIILRRIYLSQAPKLTMKTEEFAAKVVRRITGRNKGGYFTAGGGVLMFILLGYIPRSLGLWIMEKVWVKKNIQSP